MHSHQRVPGFGHQPYTRAAASNARNLTLRHHGFQFHITAAAAALIAGTLTASDLAFHPLPVHTTTTMPR